MDSVSAHLTANAGRVSKGDLVLDPFCGTGSLLLAAASLGADVIGSDIDPFSFGIDPNAPLEETAGKSKNNRFKRKLESMNDVQLNGGVRKNFEFYGLSDRLISLCSSDANNWTLPEFDPLGSSSQGSVDAGCLDPLRSSTGEGERFKLSNKRPPKQVHVHVHY